MSTIKGDGIKIIEQDAKLPVEECGLDEKDARLIHGTLFPSTMRCLIVGASGSGKTNAMMQLLRHKNGLRYENVYLISKSLYQPKYENLKKVFDLIPEMGFYRYESMEKVPDPENCKENSVIIFDDVSSTNEPNAKLRAYFSTCRHKNNSVFLLIQSYTRVPKLLIRDNCSFLIVFPQDKLNARHIYDDHLGSDISFTQFEKVCVYCWQRPYGFLVIDKYADLNNGKVRSSFHHFIEFSK